MPTRRTPHDTTSGSGSRRASHPPAETDLPSSTTTAAAAGGEPAETTGASETTSANANELGVAAAWRYLGLACYALYAPAQAALRTRLHPWLARLPRMAPATRMVLLINVMLYGAATLAFLFPSHGLRVAHTGLAVVDQPVPHLIWGLSAMLVSLLQVAVLVSTRWSVWQVCAVATAMWASAFAVVTLLLAHIAGSYGGAVVWLWICVMHFLFISNKLVPIAQEHNLVLTNVYATTTRIRTQADEEEEQQLIARLQDFIRAPTANERLTASAHAGHVSGHVTGRVAGIAR